MEKLKDSLIRKGYAVREFNTLKEAAHYVADMIPQGTVGIGGSVTVEESGLYEILQKDHKVYWHERCNAEDVMAVRKKASSADIYISSVNAIAETGEIVNIDNTGNRVAALSFGPEKVYLLIGQNKITPDRESALERAHNVAAPLNARRLKRNTPCALHADRCHDCVSPERICRIVSVFDTKPVGMDYEVLLIHEDCGF